MLSSIPTHAASTSHSHSHSHHNLLPSSPPHQPNPLLGPHAGTINKLKRRFPLYWNALVAGEVERAQVMSLNTHVTMEQFTAPIHQNMAYDIKRELPLFWVALVSGQVAAAHRIIFRHVPSQAKVMKASTTSSSQKISHVNANPRGHSTSSSTSSSSSLSYPTQTMIASDESDDDTMSTTASEEEDHQDDDHDQVHASRMDSENSFMENDRLHHRRMSMTMVPPTLNELTKQHLSFIKQFVPHSLPPKYRLSLVETLFARFPLFWHALVMGQVVSAKQRASQMVRAGFLRSDMSDQLTARFPLFYRALMAGQVRQADDLVKSFLIAAEQAASHLRSRDTITHITPVMTTTTTPSSSLTTTPPKDTDDVQCANNNN